jgi:hypothetical protein
MRILERKEAVIRERILEPRILQVMTIPLKE